MFGESEFLVGSPVLETRYVHLRSKSSNLFGLFYDQLDYTLTHYFTKLKSTKRNVDKFLSNPLMKPFIKKLLYPNANE